MTRKGAVIILAIVALATILTGVMQAGGDRILLPIVMNSGTAGSGPYRLAFYYPWFPDAWTQGGIYPYSNYEPSQGYYDGSDPDVIAQQIAAMQYGHITGGISSWWGPGHHTDARFPLLLAASAGTGFKWSVYYEGEGYGDPGVSKIDDDLSYLQAQYGNDSAYFKINGRMVVFVYGDDADRCAMAARWQAANQVNAYIVLKVFPGYADCSAQPDAWHQYAPAQAADRQGNDSYSISPGFWNVGEAPLLSRDLSRWHQDIAAMVASDATFQLITTFNEWGEGTAVESATSWASASGYGAYLDALHANGSDPPPTPIPGDDPVLVGAGDIADCSSAGDEATAALLDDIPGTVFTAGDNAYGDGSVQEFADCYDPSWGRHKQRTMPAPGNHDYHTADASGYFGYFGMAAGLPTQGYYSYDLGDWHIIVLNSNCSEIGGCGVGSPQEQWLRQDLATHPTTCTAAYFHHPLFSSGHHGSNGAMEALWQALYDYNADVVLNGHDHNYERFAPQDPSGNLDLQRGLRQFVVGTGGKSHYSVTSPLANSEVTNDDTFGVLKLTLRAGTYEWAFVPVAGATFTDAGTGVCH